MSNVDTRQVNRDSLFLLAQLRVEGHDEVHRVKIRNLSAGGAMVEGEVKVARGETVSVELRNIGWIGGSVAWKQDNRFGVAFTEEIDPMLVRSPVTTSVDSRRTPYTRSHATQAPDPSKIRKI